MDKLKLFHFWCQTVIPLVYDDSLSYYETLCKVVTYLNDVIKEVDLNSDIVNQLKNDIAEIQKWIDEFDPVYVSTLIEKYIATMIFVEITDDGYICYNIPSNWKNITFNTTGLDIKLELQPEYGHLVLSY